MVRGMPVIIVIGIFYLYPVIDVFRLSFTNATLIGDNQDYTLGSITNALSSPQLPDILWATLIFVGGSVIGQQILGLAVAVVVIRGEKRGLFGTTILRTTALVAWVVPGIAGGIIWQMLFSEAPYGALNSILRLMHMGFSLRLKRMPRTEIDQRVGNAAKILGLESLLERYPKQLSGGQRQRVAMGRAIVRDPAVFLFDEPLSNLDAKLRVQMRSEIKELHQRLQTTTIYVTHDQIEAM